MVDLARVLTLTFLCSALLSCSSAFRWEEDTYVVKAGDTIYSIAFAYDLDQRNLMAWNGIDNAALIRPGQRLRLTPPDGGSRQAATSGTRSGGSQAVSKPPPPTTQSVRWAWPTDGVLIEGYGASAKTQSGIQIGGQRGQPIRAASAGRVVYAGTGLTGYGHLLIIKHNNDYLSAYGHNDRLLAAEGDEVAAGEKIASMGTSSGNRPLLHFEIRRRGEPVNPLKYLPKR